MRIVFQAEKGVTILELLLALTVVSIAIFATTLLSDDAARLTGESSNRSEAVNSISEKEREAVMRLSRANLYTNNNIGIPSQCRTDGSDGTTDYTNYSRSSDTSRGTAITGASGGMNRVSFYDSPTDSAGRRGGVNYCIYRYVYCRSGDTCNNTNGRRIVRLVIVAAGAAPSYPDGLIDTEFIHVAPRTDFTGGIPE